MENSKSISVEKEKETFGVSFSSETVEPKELLRNSNHSGSQSQSDGLQFLNLLGQESSKMSYQAIWDLQRDLVEQIAAGRSPETIIFCEHEKVLTKGRRSKANNILDSRLPTYEIERGGDVTLHHPGQLVIYPLLKLHGDIFKKGLQEYLRFCEEIVIQFLKSCDLDAGRFGPTGVWVKSKVSNETKKIASVGIAVRKWITYHGISINISNDLSDFSALRPCDFEASIMTSLQAEGHEIGVSDAAEHLHRIIENHLGLFASKNAVAHQLLVNSNVRSNDDVSFDGGPRKAPPNFRTHDCRP